MIPMAEQNKVSQTHSLSGCECVCVHVAECEGGRQGFLSKTTRKRGGGLLSASWVRQSNLSAKVTKKKERKKEAPKQMWETLSEGRRFFVSFFFFRRSYEAKLRCQSQQSNLECLQDPAQKGGFMSHCACENGAKITERMWYSGWSAVQTSTQHSI